MAKKTQKPRKSATKRIKKTAGGLKFKKPGANHKTGKMSSKFSRKHRKGEAVSKSDRKRLNDII